MGLGDQWVETQVGWVLNLGHTPASDVQNQVPLGQYQGSGMLPGLAHPAFTLDLLPSQWRPSKCRGGRELGSIHVPQWTWETHHGGHGSTGLCWFCLPKHSRLGHPSSATPLLVLR